MSDQDLASIDGEFTLRHALAWLTGTWWRRIVLGLLVVVPLVVASAGGLAPVPERSLPRIEPGQTVEIGPFDLALEEYFVSADVHTSALPDDAQAWLGVVATVTGTDDQASRLHQSALTFPEGLIHVDGERGVNPTHNTVRRIDDGESIHSFPPGLPVQVVTLLPVQDATAVPEEITVGVTELESAWSFLLETYSWYERERVGEVTLQRTEVPPQLVEEVDE